MSEEFVATNRTQPLVEVQTVNNEEIRVAGEIAKVAGDVRVMNVVRLGAQLAQLRKFKKIENQEQYEQAIDAFGALKDGLKDLEETRHHYVDFPTKLVRYVNNFFKPIREDLENTKGHIGGLIDAKKLADQKAAEEEAGKVAEEQAQKSPEERGQGEVVSVGDGQEMPLTPELEAATRNVVTSARGVSVHTRQREVCVIENLEDFLRQCVSRSERNKWLVEEIGSLITVDTVRLAKLLREAGKRRLKGVRIEMVRTTV